MNDVLKAKICIGLYIKGKTTSTAGWGNYNPFDPEDIAKLRALLNNFEKRPECINFDLLEKVIDY